MTGEIAGLVLAGGRSRRMGGGDKSLLPLGGESMLARAIRRIGLPPERIAISANGDPGRFAAFGLPVIADTVGEYWGPLAGILAGLEWAAECTPCRALVSVAGDTPFFPTDLVRRLNEASAGHPDRIAVAASDGRLHPVFALWPIAMREALRMFLLDGATFRMTDFVVQQGYISVDFPLMPSADALADPFFNVNTPADLERAEALRQEFAP